MNQSVSKKHPRSAPLARGKQTPLQITAPALLNFHGAMISFQVSGPAVLGRTAEAKATGTSTSYLLQYSQVIVERTCSTLLALCPKLEDSMSGTMRKIPFVLGKIHE